MHHRAALLEASPRVRFLGMRQLVAVLLAGCFAVAAYWSLRLGYADRVFRGGGLAGAQSARRLAPGNASYYREGPDSNEVATLERAVALNPHDSRGWIELGLAAELAGRSGEAERWLVQAVNVDRTYEPCWTLANFYFRRGNREALFRWSRQAARMSYENQNALFALCWRSGATSSEILNGAIPREPGMLEQYLKFPPVWGDPKAAAEVVRLLLPLASSAQAPALVEYTERLLLVSPDAAIEAWNALSRRRLISVAPLDPAAGASLTNGDFSSDPLQRGFDWRLHGVEGVRYARYGSPVEFRVAFSGGQPESCRLVEQTLPLLPSRGYRLRYRYRAEGIPPDSGLRWVIGDSAHSWATSEDLSGEGWTEGEVRFHTPEPPGLARLSLDYRRTLGTTRIEGAIYLRRVWLEFEP